MIRTLASCFDAEWLKKHVCEMYRIERKQTFPAWQKSAQYAYDLLKSEGFEPEKIDFPADGRAVYQDKITPIGWDCAHMTCTLLSKVPGISDPVIADFSREPLEVVKGSCATPPGGMDAKVVAEGQMKAGENVRGAFILLDPGTRPRGDAMRMLLDLGAAGWISDYVENPMCDPDGVAWINAGTEYNSWHIQADDRPFIAFQISERKGFALRRAVNRGGVKVHVESDARRYETFLPAVTAVLRGDDPREVWLNAHLYEPLIDDNASGVIGSIALMKALRQLQAEGKIHLKYSVRCVFASEMYGFAAFAEHFGEMKSTTLGGIVMDGLLASTDKTVMKRFMCNEAADYRFENDRSGGFAGNIMFSEVVDEARSEIPGIEIMTADHFMCDDTFMSDASNGLPTLWLRHGPQGFHHNSAQDEAKYDGDGLVVNLQLCTEWVRRMTASSEAEIRDILPRAVARAEAHLAAAAGKSVRPGTDNAARMDFLRVQEANRIRALSLWADIPEIAAAAESLKMPEIPEAPVAAPVPEVPAYAAPQRRSWYDYAADFCFTRVMRGFPHDLARISRENRRRMPGAILYDDISDIVSRMTPGVSFQDLIRETEWDRGKIYSENTIRKYLFTCTYLADAGYFAMEQKNAENADNLAAALKKLGVREGGTLLVHSSISSLGYVPGGVSTVMKALGKAVGPEGTYMVPAFTTPYISFEGSVNKTCGFRPYDTRPDGDLRDAAIWTGALPKAVLKTPGVKRSGHVSHEWAAIGAHAAEAVAGHGFLDAPTGATSPLRYALEHDGDVVFLGCSISSNTFLHYCETIFDAPCLACGIVKYITADGTLRSGLIEKHLPGDRDFYHDPAKSQFYAEAVKRGLHIYTVPFSMGTLLRMNLRELYDITMQMFRDDPWATGGRG